MIYCSSCGNKIIDKNAQFCPSCGKSLKFSKDSNIQVDTKIPKEKSINPLHSFAYLILFLGVFAFIWAWIFPSHEDYVNVIPSSIDFYVLDNDFGSGSNLTDLQKDQKWDYYEGYYVKWTGTVKAVGTSFGDSYIGLKMKESTWTYDVRVTFREEYINRLSYVNKGEKITVIGKIIRGGGGLLPISLVDGRFTD